MSYHELLGCGVCSKLVAGAAAADGVTGPVRLRSLASLFTRLGRKTYARQVVIACFWHELRPETPIAL